MGMGHEGIEDRRGSEWVTAHRTSAHAPSIESQIATLVRIEAHHAWLRGHDEALATRGARAKWLDGVILLGCTPAERREDGATKVGYLRGALGSALALDAMIDDQEGAVVMVIAAAMCEADRWSLQELDPVASRDARDAAGVPGAEAMPSPQEVALYRGAGEERTLADAVGRVGLAERDLDESRRSGGEGAVAGATGRLRLRVLEAMATSAWSVGELEAKQAILCRHRDLCGPRWLVDSMIGAPLRLEYRVMDLSPDEEVRLQSQLPHGTVEVAPGPIGISPDGRSPGVDDPRDAPRRGVLGRRRVGDVADGGRS